MQESRDRRVVVVEWKAGLISRMGHLMRRGGQSSRSMWAMSFREFMLSYEAFSVYLDAEAKEHEEASRG